MLKEIQVFGPQVYWNYMSIIIFVILFLWFCH